MGRPESTVEVRVFGEGMILRVDGVVQSRIGYMDLVGANSKGSRICPQSVRVGGDGDTVLYALYLWCSCSKTCSARPDLLIEYSHHVESAAERGPRKEATGWK